MSFLWVSWWPEILWKQLSDIHSLLESAWIFILQAICFTMREWTRQIVIGPRSLMNEEECTLLHGLSTISRLPLGEPQKVIFTIFLGTFVSFCFLLFGFLLFAAALIQPFCTKTIFISLHSSILFTATSVSGDVRWWEITRKWRIFRPWLHGILIESLIWFFKL